MSRYAQAADEAAELTNKQLAERIASLNHLTEARVKTLFPKKRDKEQFLEFIAAVEQETSEKKRIALINKNIATYAPVLLKLAASFIR